MENLKKYAIVLYPIAFFVAFGLSVNYTSIAPLAVVAVLMLVSSKLMKQF